MLILTECGLCGKRLDAVFLFRRPLEQQRMCRTFEMELACGECSREAVGDVSLETGRPLNRILQGISVDKCRCCQKPLDGVLHFAHVRWERMFKGTQFLVLCRNCAIRAFEEEKDKSAVSKLITSFQVALN